MKFVRNLFKKDIFDKKFIESLNFIIEKDNKVYGKAISKRPKGKVILSWNRKRTNIDYFGNKINPNNSYFEIKDDGGTRTTFSGIIYSRKQLKLLLKLTC